MAGWRDAMGMTETALQVARKMRAQDFSDDETRAELCRRAELGDWSPDEVESAASDSRWTTSAGLEAALVTGDKSALAAVHRGVLLDLLASEAKGHLLTAEEELEAVSDPDAVLNRHGVVAATETAGKRDMALALLRRKAAEDPRRCLRAVRAVLGRGFTSHQTNAPAPSRTAPRARGRRERHVQRSTSSTSSGEPGEPHLPGLARFRRAIRRSPGLAECPCCNNIAHLRPRCRLCRGLGFVARELRNRWKRGYRP